MSNPVGVSLGSAYGKVIISTNVAEAMQEARNQFQNGIAAMGSSISALGDQIAGVGARVSILTQPLARIGSAGLEAASDFDSAMTMISARTGLVGKDLEEVRQFALKMGADTVFSSQQAADAFLNLLASGQTTEQAIATLPAVLSAAAASGEDLGRSADVVTNVLASFGLEATASADVVNVLAQAAGASKASIGSLGDGFANLGPIAKQYGLSVKDTAAVLGLFAQNGIAGAEAGTQLKSMLTNMTRPTDVTQGAWDRLGVTMYDAQGNIRNLNDVMAELDKALDQLPVEEQNELMYQLAGSYGLAGFSALRSGMSIEEMQQQMDAQASAADVAQKMMATFRNTIESLKGSFETLLINAITPFMNEGLKPLAEGMINLVNRLNDWVLANPELTKQIVTVLAALIALGPVLLGLGLAISTIGAALSGLGVLFSALLSPVGLLIAAASLFAVAWETNLLGIQATVVAVGARISQAFNLFRAAVAATWLSIQTGVEPLLAIRTTFGSLIDDMLRMVGVSDGVASFIQDAFRRMVDAASFLIDVFNDIGDRVGRAFSIAAAAVRAVFYAINAGIDPLVAIRIAFSALIDDILSALGVSDQFAASVRRGFTRIMDALLPMFREIGEFISNFFASFDFSGMVGGVSDAFGTVFANIDFGKIASLIYQIGSWIAALSNPILLVGKLLMAAFNVDLIGVFEAIAGAITEFFAALNDGVSVVDAVGRAIGSVFGAEAQTTWNNFMSSLGQMIPILIDLFNQFVDGALTTFQTAVETVGSTIAGLWDMISPALSFIANWFLTEALPAIISLIQNGFLPAIEGIVTFIGGMWEIIAPSLMAFANWFLTEAIPAIMTFISGTVIPGIELLITTLTRIWNDVSPFLLQLFDWFVNTGLPIVVNFIQTTVQPIIETFFGYIAQVWEAIQPALASVYDWFVTTALPGMMNFLQTVVQPIIEGFFNFIRDAWILIEPALTAFFNWFTVDALPAIYSFLNDTVRPVVEGFFNFIGGIWALVSASLGSLFDWFNTSGMPVIQGVIENIWHNVVEPFINLLKGIWEAVRPGFEAFGNGVKEFLKPIQDLIEGITNALGEISGRAQALAGAGQNAQVVAGAIASGELSPGDFFSRLGGAIQAEFSGAPSHAVGSDFIPQDMLVKAHRGEAIVPEDLNTNGRMGGRGGINIENLNINANSEAEGRAAARGFQKEMEEWEQFNG